MKTTIQLDDKDLTTADERVAGNQRSSPAPSDPVLGIAVPSYSGVVIGDLIGLKDDGRTPLVLFPGQRGSAAVAARSVIDLYGRHIGSQVALMFDTADGAKPIVVGVLRESTGYPLEQANGQAEVETDGERLIVTAKQQLTLRCGDASITLTREGKVLIQGTFVLSRSSGLNRIVGGSIQIN
jgi:hypothetical protein